MKFHKKIFDKKNPVYPVINLKNYEKILFNFLIKERSENISLSISPKEETIFIKEMSNSCDKQNEKKSSLAIVDEKIKLSKKNYEKKISLVNLKKITFKKSIIESENFSEEDELEKREENFTMFKNLTEKRKRKKENTDLGFSGRYKSLFRNKSIKRIRKKTKLEITDIFNFFAINKSKFLIKKFIHKLEIQSGLRSKNLLTKNIISTINDFSASSYTLLNFEGKYTLKFQKLTVFFQKIFLICEKYLHKIPIFDPSKNYKYFWDFIDFIVSTLYFFVIPYDLSFSEKIIPDFSIFQAIISKFFTLNFIVKMNTGIFEKGKIHFSRKQILKNYLKTDFIIDLLSIYPVILNRREIYDLIFFIKIFQLGKLFQKLELFFFIDDKISNYINLFGLIFKLLWFTHIGACIWFYIGKKNLYIDPNNWLTVYGIDNKSQVDAYIYSFYYTAITMVTVGYGI